MHQCTCVYIIVQLCTVYMRGDKMNKKILISIGCVLCGLVICYMIFSASTGNDDVEINMDLLISLGPQINESVYYEDLDKGLLDSSCEDGLYVLRSESGYTWTIKTDTNDTVQYVLRARS